MKIKLKIEEDLVSLKSKTIYEICTVFLVKSSNKWFNVNYHENKIELIRRFGGAKEQNNI